MPQHKIPTQTRALAKTMRRQPTEAETALWRILRDRRLSRLKFRRQAPIRPHIADFVCFEHRLIIEADGSQHAENVRDEKRDRFLAEQGFCDSAFLEQRYFKQSPDNRGDYSGALRLALVSALASKESACGFLIRRFAPPSPAKGRREPLSQIGTPLPSPSVMPCQA